VGKGGTDRRSLVLRLDLCTILLQLESRTLLLLGRHCCTPFLVHTRHPVLRLCTLPLHHHRGSRPSVQVVLLRTVLLRQVGGRTRLNRREDREGASVGGRTLVEDRPSCAEGEDVWMPYWKVRVACRTKSVLLDLDTDPLSFKMAQAYSTPSIPPDALHVSLYPPQTVSSSHAATLAYTVRLRAAVDGLLPAGWTWHRDSFDLHPARLHRREESQAEREKEEWVVRGGMRVGESIEDEWVGVWLVRELTRQFEGLTASFVHSPRIPPSCPPLLRPQLI
jgi:hypothetical protein